MFAARLWSALVLFVVALSFSACTNAPPRLIQVFSQVNQVYLPVPHTWSSRLTVFVQATSSDGNKVFDRLHLVHDGTNLYFSLSRDQWTSLDRPGEFWFGANNLSFPDGQVPRGTWRVMVVTRSGQKVETTFEVPPVAPGAPDPMTGRVSVKADPKAPNHYSVAGWVPDYLVWALDPKGTVISRLKTAGSSFTLPSGAPSFQLYSYDKNRGEGLVAGPFLVQDR